MDKEKLEQLKKLAKKATRGEWEKTWNDQPGWRGGLVRSANTRKRERDIAYFVNEADANFVATATPDVVLELIDKIENPQADADIDGENPFTIDDTTIEADKIEILKGLAKHAIPGPWEYYHNPVYKKWRHLIRRESEYSGADKWIPYLTDVCQMVINKRDHPLRKPSKIEIEEANADTGAYIAAASPDVILKLIDENERLKDENERLRAAMGQ